MWLFLLVLVTICVIVHVEVIPNEYRKHVIIINKFRTICAINMLCAILLGFLFGINIHNNTPQAIDVYRGNTQIEKAITIKDNDTIKIDSIVIYKQDFNR